MDRAISSECDNSNSHGAGVGITPYPQSGGAAEQCSVGCLTVMGNIRVFGANPLTLTPVTCLNRASAACVTVAPAVLPLRVEREGFLLTYSGQSAINVFTASGFNGNFVFVPVEHRRHKKTIVCRRVRFSMRPDGRKGFRKTTLRPTRRSSLGWLNGF
jgi:hypothetical protein